MSMEGNKSYVDGSEDASLVSLVVRGDKLPLRHAIASCYNAPVGHLVVVTAPALYLYGNVLELGGEVLGMITAEENVHFQSAIVLPWLNAYSVVATHHNGCINHRIVSADFSVCHVTHVIAESGTIFSTIANPLRHEVITADSDGGFKVWVIRSTGAQTNSMAMPKWKGFQRIHAGSRKTNYISLMIASDDQTILACTKTRIQAYDTTTCTRIGTLYKDASRTIIRTAYDREGNALYVQFVEAPSFLYKLQGSLSRGRLQSLDAVGMISSAEDITAVEPIVRGTSRGHQACEIFYVDTSGKFRVGSCLVHTNSASIDCRSIGLPLVPSAETYVAVHSQTHHKESRNFVIIITSSGLVVVEVILPETYMPARRVTTNIAGTKIALLESEGNRKIGIYNSTPPSLLLFDEAKSDMFYAILLQDPGDGGGVQEQSTANGVVDFTAVRFGMLFVWSSGAIMHFCLQSERTHAVGRVLGVPSIVKAVSRCDDPQDELVFVGDESGVVHMWSIQEDNGAVHLGSKKLHNQRMQSITPIKGESSLVSVHLLSVCIDGEVKYWRVPHDLSMTWDLLVCFHTYAAAISAAALMGTEFLFCGSKEGGFECWQLPILPPSSTISGRGHVTVLKHPIHSLDVHLTTICQVIVEARDAATRVSTAQPFMDEFAWVITYDADQVVLIWCFSTTVLFPHRKLRLHMLPIGGFFSAVNESTYHLYAYLGRCLDCIDVASEIDKAALKRMLARVRDSDTQTTRMRPRTLIQNVEVRSHPKLHLEKSDSTLAARVSLRVMLPPVAQVDAFVAHEAARRNSPSKMSKTRTEQEHDDVSFETRTPLVAVPHDHNSNEGQSCEVRSLSPSFAMGKEPQLVFQDEQIATRSALIRQSVPRSSTYAPDSIPSQFQRAKPRIYRASHRPVTTMSQSRCTVVTSIGAGSGLTSPSADSGAGNELDRDQFCEGKQRHQQERVAIVTVRDDDLAGRLRLDFQSSGSTRQNTSNGKNVTSSNSVKRNQSPVQRIEWLSLTKEYQLVELMAATRSRFVVQEAAEEKLALPSHEDFSSEDVRAQLKVHAFTRWYLSSQHGRQHIRDAFLHEELRCAAQDAFVAISVKSCGCAVPPENEIDDEDSQNWTRFTTWYATGDPVLRPNDPMDATKRLADRLLERATFLKRRLESLKQAEHDLKSHGLAGDSTYVFDVSHGVSVPRAMADYTSWEAMSAKCKQLELLHALNDPTIQVAAMADDIELPDIFMTNLEPNDVCTVASSFAAWWGAAGNVYRHVFVNQELVDAANDGWVQNALKEIKEGESQELQSFQMTYFQSHSIREKFLSQTLSHERRHTRIDAIFRNGKEPVPILFEATQTSMTVPFIFRSELASIAESTAVIAPEEVDEIVRDTTAREVVTRDKLTSIDLADQVGHESQEDELALMAIEDALSRELNDGYESASDDDQDAERMSIEPPKRTDFTTSYFFGNLPKTFRVNTGGWVAGSGIDNGDEEIDEEERLERERQHQEMLDRLEAERIAEAERQAERMRIEKEMDEKALQIKRLRQLELRKIMAYQVELQARRLEQEEHEAMLREQAAIEDEERIMRAWLVHLEAERNAMRLEDELVTRIALAVRNARRHEMRRVLAETTLMDAEDRRSAIAQAELLERERQQRLRIEYLTELYAPFEPFFQESNAPAEEMLPIITRRQKTSTRPRKRGYTLPTTEFLSLGEDVEQEHYAVRDSRKLRQLLGLPFTTPNSRRMMRIPSEREIIQTRRDLQLMLPPANDRLEEDRVDTVDGLDFAPAREVATPNQIDHLKQRAKLPELVQWKAQNDQRLTDLRASVNAASPNQSKNTIKTNAKSEDQSVRQQTALPFFRGNFIVEGTRPRSQAYVTQK